LFSGRVVILLGIEIVIRSHRFRLRNIIGEDEMHTEAACYSYVFNGYSTCVRALLQVPYINHGPLQAELSQPFSCRS